MSKLRFPNQMKYNFFLKNSRTRARKVGEKGVTRRKLDVREVVLTQQDPRKKMSLI